MAFHNHTDQIKKKKKRRKKTQNKESSLLALELAEERLLCMQTTKIRLLHCPRDSTFVSIHRIQHFVYFTMPWRNFCFLLNCLTMGIVFKETDKLHPLFQDTSVSNKPLSLN